MTKLESSNQVKDPPWRARSSNGEARNKDGMTPFVVLFRHSIPPRPVFDIRHSDLFRGFELRHSSLEFPPVVTLSASVPLSYRLHRRLLPRLCNVQPPEHQLLVQRGG